MTITHPGENGFTLRTRAQISRFFIGIDLVEPGVGMVSRWHREPGDLPPADDQIAVVGGVARKPGRPPA
ncbi:MAG: SAM-dependent methyltransferase [Actinomycetota bacterium]|nr:SAM-dependent methyltransferase [Actinomycetota bacterium]